MEHVVLEAGPHAFGDGSHPTTAGVLVALERIDPAAFTPRMACDMGAGSGILALAIVRQFGCPVVAVDIERQSIEIIQENFRISGCEGQVMAIHSDGFGHPEIAAHAPYDLIVMNILADPLMRLAVEAEQALAGEGVLIISGLLQWQEPQMIEAYQALGLELTSRVVIGDWVTLVWQKE